MEKQISASSEYPFLNGKGEMAALIAGYDWSKNELGPISSWPDHLKSFLTMMLSSRFPMLIFWGPDLITFYNDAFRPSLGNDGKHPGSLGQRGAVSWSESWPVIGPMIADIMKGGDAVWFEDQKLPLYRDGKMGYAYWTYSFSALTDSKGKIEGVLVTCSETTKAVESLKQLSQYADELSFAIESMELGTWDLNPHTGKFVANNRLKEWFGLRPEEEVPLSSAIDSIEEQDRERVSNLIASALDHANGGSYETTYTIIHPGTKQKRVVLAKGRAWFAEDKTAYRLNGTLQDITPFTLAEIESARVKKAAEESEARLRLMMSQAPSAISVYRGKGEHLIELANDRMIRIWGKDRSVIGKPLLAAVPELEGQPFLGILDDIYETKKPFHGIDLPAKLIVDGELQTFYFNFTYQPIIDEKGEVTGILNIAEDVTEKRKSIKALEEAALFSTSVVDHSPVAKIVYIGYDMVLRTVNRMMLDLLGKGDSIIGKPFKEVFPELEGTHLLETMRSVFTTGETVVQDEERIELVKHGKLQAGYYSYIYKALKNTDGEIYGIIVTANDVTNQVLVRKKIEAAELKLSGAIELAQLSTWSIDYSTKKVTYSPRLQEWLGIKDAFFNDNPNRVAKEDHERVVKAVERAMDPTGDGHFDEIYTIVNTMNGHRRIIHGHAQLIYGDNNEPLELSGIAQDITFQKEAQLSLEQEVQLRTEELASSNEELTATVEELATTNNSLTDINKQLEQYAYVASHDLQEPLRKIEVFSSLLGERVSLDAKDREYIAKINKSANRMRSLINDLLEFSRLMHSGTMPKTKVNLNSIVRELKEDFELSLQEKQALLQIEELPVVEAAPLQISQVFYNLISNALKFVNKDTTPKIKIWSELIAPENIQLYFAHPVKGQAYYKISIQDNGIGIEAEHTEKIFEVFRRLHAKDSYSGSGIGLSICRMIINSHDGHLYCESEFGKGTTFHILLPAV